MANADFSRDQSSTPGGFDAGSYRETTRAEQEIPLTPLQQKLAKLENALPAALGKQATAILLMIVIMAVSAVGFGGGKLRSRYREAQQWYTVGVSADGGYNLNEELTTRQNAAANIITTGTNSLGADSVEVQAAQSALKEFGDALERVNRDGAGMHDLYAADAALGSAIDQLYAKLQEQAADPMKMGAVQGQYGQFNSSATVIGNLSYNQAVASYEKETGGFPASLLKGLFGIKEVEPFA